MKKNIIFKSKAVLLVIVLTIGFASLSCKSPGDMSLQENTEIELMDTQEEEVLQEKEPFSTEELFLWKKHLDHQARFSSKSIYGNQLYCFVDGSIMGIHLENGKEIGKEALFFEGSFHEILFNGSILLIRTVKDSYDYLSAWNKNSKEKIWSQRMDHPKHSALTLYKDMILYGSFNGYIYALDIEDGSLRWRFSFEDAVGKGFYPQQYTEEIKSYRSGDIMHQKIEDFSISLTSKLWIKNNVLYCYYNGELPNYYPHNNGLIYAIDLSTQKLLWKTLLPEIITSSIFFESHQDNDKLYVSTWKAIYEIDSRTGQFNDIPVESLDITKSLVGFNDDFFVISGGPIFYWVSRADHSIAQREYQKLSDGMMRLWYRNVTQMVVDKHPYQFIAHDVLILANSERSLVMLDLNSGDIILHWINTNRTVEAWVDAFRHQDIFIAWDGFGIYALDLKKVFMRWLDTKETIEIVTGRE